MYTHGATLGSFWDLDHLSLSIQSGPLNLEGKFRGVQYFVSG
jgi:hypothetical protein